MHRSYNTDFFNSSHSQTHKLRQNKLAKNKKFATRFTTSRGETTNLFIRSISCKIPNILRATDVYAYVFRHRHLYISSRYINTNDISTLYNHPNHSGIRSCHTQWLCHFDSIPYITGSTNYCSRNIAAMGAELWVPHHHRLFLIPSNQKTLLNPRFSQNVFHLKNNSTPPFPYKKIIKFYLNNIFFVNFYK
jgi:hypothetical protein